MSLLFHPELLNPLIALLQGLEDAWRNAAMALAPEEAWEELYSGLFDVVPHPALVQQVQPGHPFYAHWPTGVPVPPFPPGTLVQDVMHYIGAQLNCMYGFADLRTIKSQLQIMKKQIASGNHAKFMEAWRSIRYAQTKLQETFETAEFQNSGAAAYLESHPAEKEILRRVMKFKQDQDVDSYRPTARRKSESFIYFLNEVLRKVQHPYYPSDPNELMNPQAVFESVPLERRWGFTMPVLPNPMRRGDLFAVLNDLLAKANANAKRRDALNVRLKRVHRALLLQKVIEAKGAPFATQARVEHALDSVSRGAAQSAAASRDAARKLKRNYEKRHQDELERLETHLKLLEAAGTALATWTPDKPLPALLQEPGLQALLTEGHPIHEELPGLGAFPYLVAPSAVAEAAAAAAAGVEEHKGESDDDEYVPGLQKRQRPY